MRQRLILHMTKPKISTSAPFCIISQTVELVYVLIIENICMVYLTEKIILL